MRSGLVTRRTLVTLAIFQQFADAIEATEQILNVGEVTIRREFHGRNAIGDGPHRFEDPALEREDVLHVPFERGGHADEAHGFGGGRAIEHDDVVALFAAELIDVHHGAQLFHAGKDGQFLGFDVADAGGAQHGDHVGRNFAPVAFDLLLDVDFVDGELLVDGVGSPVWPWKRLVSRSKESARLWAGSTLMTSVRYPSRESCSPVAAARLVFPTPPLPLKRRMRMSLL